MKIHLRKFTVTAVGMLALALFLTSLIREARAQEFTVRGTVLYNPEMNDCLKEVPCLEDIKLTDEEDWVPTPAAVNIMVKGTDRVVKTDREGNYQITAASQTDTLLFMYISHNRIEVPIEGRNVVDARLTPTPLPVIDRLLGLIMPKVIENEYPDLDNIADQGNVNRATARDIMWLVLGNTRMAEHYPGEYIPDYNFEED